MYNEPVEMTINLDGCELVITQEPIFEVSANFWRSPNVSVDFTEKNYLTVMYDVLENEGGKVDVHPHGGGDSGNIEWTFTAPSSAKFAGIRPGRRPDLWCAVNLAIGAEYDGLQSLDIRMSRESVVIAADVSTLPQR